MDVTFYECMTYYTTKDNQTMEDRMESNQDHKARLFLLPREEITSPTSFRQNT